MITKEQLKNEIDALEDVQTLELVHQLIQNIKTSSSNTVKKYTKEAKIKALDEFSGTFDELKIDDVESTLRTVRKGRRGLWNAI
jgi:hypothetical protein